MGVSQFSFHILLPIIIRTVANQLLALNIYVFSKIKSEYSSRMK